MTKRAWTLVLSVWVCLAVPSCGGDDDSGGDGDGNAGTGTNAGRGGSTSNAGRGGSTSNAGSGTSGSGNPIAECMAEEMMGGDTSGCEGIEDYSECVQDMCLADCMSDCQAYYDCVQDAADPCMPTGCQPNSQCTSCLASATNCISGCISLLMCGETTPGGACDQLDDCCATFSMPMICQQAASGARAAGGDMLCMTVMGAFCM